MISKETIDRVFDAARVEEVIGDFVNLKKAGANYKGLSPFADEKTPSFMVSPVKQIWKDFSTGKGGNAVTFLMEHEHYSYPEALRYLAKKYQIEVEETVQSEAQKEKANERESMFLVSEFARDYFVEQLWENESGKAIGLTYFKERAFEDQFIKKFELGYSPDRWTALTQAALDKKYELDFLEKTGLTIVKEDKSFDRFKGRVMFPIHSMSGRVLGFGGRTLRTDKNVAKYVNSPETEIYHKSKVLYGIYQAKQSIAKLDNCYLVEGYTDVISFHQSGVENVVASSGTALTSDQIRLINRLTNNVTVIFDGDAAGLRAALRGIDLILEQGMNVKVIPLSDGEDPDSFAKGKSKDELSAYLQEAAQDFIQFKASLWLEESRKDPVKRAELIRDIVHSISMIPNTIQKEVYIQECAHIMNISEEVLFNEMSQLLRKRNKDQGQQRVAKTPFTGVKKEKVAVEKVDPINKLERKLIEILLLYGNLEIEFTDFTHQSSEEGELKVVSETYKNSISSEIYMHLQEDEIQFTDPIFLKIYYSIIHLLNQNQPIGVDHFTNHEDASVAAMVTDILMEEERYQLSDWEKHNIVVRAKEDHLSKLVMDVLYNLRRELIAQKISVLQQELEPSPEMEVQKTASVEVMESIKDYTSLKRLLFEKLNRVI